MRGTSIILILIFAIHQNVTIAQERDKQRIDFSSVDAFWGIAEKISNAMETEADWDYLFSTGYYQFYNNWGQRKYIQNTLVTALSPKKKFKEIENDSTSLIMKSISQLQLEGIADMIDKDRFLNSDGRGFPSIISANFKRIHADPLPALQKMDSLLVAISKDPSSALRHSEAIFNLLPLGVHPHGFYMAKTILKVYGKRKLLSTVRNPFDFIRVYNNAYFKLNGTVLFSEEATKFLFHVENTHSF